MPKSDITEKSLLSLGLVKVVWGMFDHMRSYVIKMDKPFYRGGIIYRYAGVTFDYYSIDGRNLWVHAILLEEVEIRNPRCFSLHGGYTRTISSVMRQLKPYIDLSPADFELELSV